MAPAFQEKCIQKTDPAYSAFTCKECPQFNNNKNLI